MSRIRHRRHDVAFLPESKRVIIRPYIPENPRHVTTIIGRALSIPENQVAQELGSLKREFDSRHFDIDSLLELHFEKVRNQIFTQRPLSRQRALLIGALFSGEFALESAAIFNPSIVPHPDQGGLAAGAMRFIMSLRATGEGHISSIEFRSGVIGQGGDILMDPVSRYVTVPEILPNPSYDKKRFAIKLDEMGLDSSHFVKSNPAEGIQQRRRHDAGSILEPLGDQFTREELEGRISQVMDDEVPATHELKKTLEAVKWLADSNYELRFSGRLAMSERIIFPVSRNESDGIEDARFVRFTDEDGSVMYYATYTAYNGHTILPQLIETKDFLNFRILTLNGDAVQNKGMALFPRRIGGRFAMLSRQDDENIFLMYSGSPHYWKDPRIILRPAEPWESVKIGNCGSPIETGAGWLVITHGVGPMRKYCIGAVLLDLEDPSRVIGRLKEPLLAPEGDEREGYVPNVVYSCGSLIHSRELILPFALGDRSSSIASIPIDELLSELKAPEPVSEECVCEVLGGRSIR